MFRCHAERSGSAYFSRAVENLSPNLSHTRREALIVPPSLPGKGVRGLGFLWTFPHDVKSQSGSEVKHLMVISYGQVRFEMWNN
jgi:hypothetical protein